MLSINARFKKSSKNYEVYESNEHGVILNLYIPKEEFDQHGRLGKVGTRAPATLSIAIQPAATPAAAGPGDD